MENVLISKTGHAKLCDMGGAKECLEEDGVRTTTLVVGTPHYIAPEILLGHSYDQSVDYWSLGILSHELVNLASPFYRDTVDEIQDAILGEEYQPNPDTSSEMKSFLIRILNKDPSARLGMIENRRPIRQHRYFGGIDWEEAAEGRMRPPVIPDENVPDIPEDEPSVELAPVELNDEMQKHLHHFEGFDWVSDEFVAAAAASKRKEETPSSNSNKNNKPLDDAQRRARTL